MPHISKSIVSESLVYLISNILNAAIPFILLPILTRHLTPAEYGEIAIFQSLIGALGAFVGVSAASVAGRKYYDAGFDAHEFGIFITTCLQVIVVSGIAIIIIFYFFRLNLSEWLGLRVEWIILSAIVSIAISISQLRLLQWQVRRQAWHYGALQVANSLINMLLSLILVLFFLLGSEGRILAQLLSTIIIAMLAIFFLKKDGMLTFFVYRPQYALEVLRFGLPLVPHLTASFLLTSVDRIVINEEVGLAGAGIYMVAVQLSGVVGIIFDAVNKAYTPWLYSKLALNNFNTNISIVKYTYAWFFLAIVFAVIGFFVGPFFVMLIAGHDYNKAGEVIGWLVVGQTFGGMYYMFSGYVFYSKNTGVLSIATIFSGILNIFLLIYFTRALGINGAAISFAISMFIRFVLTWLVAQKSHPMPWFNFRSIISSVGADRKVSHF